MVIMLGLSLRSDLFLQFRPTLRLFHMTPRLPLGLRPWRPGTGPRNGDSRKVLAGVLAQVLAKMGVLAGVLAQVLADHVPLVNTETTWPASTCASTPASTPIFASTCASTPVPGSSHAPVLALSVAV